MALDAGSLVRRFLATDPGEVQAPRQDCWPEPKAPFLLETPASARRHPLEKAQKSTERTATQPWSDAPRNAATVATTHATSLEGKRDRDGREGGAAKGT